MTSLRRFRDTLTGACTYLISSAASRTAVFIDPVQAQLPLYLGVIQELGLNLAAVLETHLHADHISGAAALRQRTGATVVVGSESGIVRADRFLVDGELLVVADFAFQALATPGHTPGCITYRYGDRLFTGDALLIGGCGRIDEPGGNPGQLFDSVTRHLLSLADELLVLPGHGSQQRWVSCIGEERRNNPLFAGVSRDEFIAHSQRRWEAPLPDFTTILAANRRCGEAAGDGPTTEYQH